jgi:hypothetical protein
MNTNNITWRDMRICSTQEILSFIDTEANATTTTSQDFQKALTLVLTIIQSPPPAKPRKLRALGPQERRQLATKFYHARVLENDLGIINFLLGHTSEDFLYRYIDDFISGRDI